MKVHSLEKTFLALSILVLVAAMLALVYASLGMGIYLPGRVGQIDPAQVRVTPPFDNPGVRQIAPDRYEVVIIGQAWTFVPEEIRVPAGVDIVFTATSPDVIHGFNVEGTRLNMMLIPGQISRNEFRFTEPGEYAIICHEFCGLGHHTMFGRVIVE